MILEPSAVQQGSSANLLVGKFSQDLFDRLAPAFERVKLEQAQNLAVHNQTPSHAYFPEGGVCSIISLASGNELPTEVGLFGREGVSSVAVLLHPQATQLTTTVQINGQTALRIELARLREEMDREPELRGLILAFAQVMMHQLASNAAAYSHHQLEARLARWLLMCHDRVGTDELALTHEFIGTMLGSRRSSVTVTLHVLEGMGAIRSSRGNVTVRDRAKLEDLAGATYGVAEGEYKKLIGDFI